MSWRQSSTSRPNETDANAVTQISKIKFENAKLRIEMENISKAAQTKLQEVAKLERVIAQSKSREDKLKSGLHKICNLLACKGFNQVEDINHLLHIIEGKVQENQQMVAKNMQKYKQLEQIDSSQFKKLRNALKQASSVRLKLQQKQQEIKQLAAMTRSKTNQVQSLTLELQTKDSMLAELKAQLHNLQLQKLQMTEQLKQFRSTSRSFKTEQAKRNCEQLLAQLNVKNEDYLKSYLLKNHRASPYPSTLSRRNKYDFIFRD